GVIGAPMRASSYRPTSGRKRLRGLTRATRRPTWRGASTYRRRRSANWRRLALSTTPRSANKATPEWPFSTKAKRQTVLIHLVFEPLILLLFTPIASSWQRRPSPPRDSRHCRVGASYPRDARARCCRRRLCRPRPARRRRQRGAVDEGIALQV